MRDIEPAPRPYLMKNKVQHYAWGQKGRQSYIADFLGLTTDADAPHAEIWMGTHPNGPSDIITDSHRLSLAQLIERDPERILGRNVAHEFSNSLPFLFKILSAGEPLSIQAHPDRHQARLLHQNDPAHYPDSNHKPELAVALDSLDALLGFKNLEGIRETFRRTPELFQWIEGEEWETMITTNAPISMIDEEILLKKMYQSILKAAIDAPEQLIQTNQRIKNRLENEKKHLTTQERLFMDLEPRYTSKDIGLLMIFLLQMIHLEKGEAIAIPPGIPHAYLKGNIIECMANSDNVVRAGLTPKFRDTNTLIDILDYRPPENPVITGGNDENDYTYPTPFNEFQITRMSLIKGEDRIIPFPSAPRIMLVTAGHLQLKWREGESVNAISLKRGMSVFVPACVDTLNMIADHNAEVYLASVP